MVSGRTDSPVVSIQFHVEENSQYRPIFDKVSEDLDLETCGLARVTFVADINERSDMVARRLTREDEVINVDSDTVHAVYGDRSDDMLGITSYDGRTGVRTRAPRYIFVVQDRIPNSTMAEYVLLHEVGHALGMDHTKHGLMYAYAPIVVFPWMVLWHDADRKEFCNIYGCNPDVLRECSRAGESRSIVR